MSNPRPESRIKSLEQRATDIEADIVELSNDTAESLRVIRQDNRELFEHVQKGFDQAHAYIQENIEAVMATKEDLSKLETRLDHIEATMATKDDISRLESDITSIKSTQEQILKLLQQRSGE